MSGRELAITELHLDELARRRRELLALPSPLGLEDRLALEAIDEELAQRRRPINDVLLRAQQAGIEGAFRLLLAVFDAGDDLYSKEAALGEIPETSGSWLRFRQAMVDAEVGLLGYDRDETMVHWAVGDEYFEVDGEERFDLDDVAADAQTLGEEP